MLNDSISQHFHVRNKHSHEVTITLMIALEVLYSSVWLGIATALGIDECCSAVIISGTIPLMITAE